MASCGEVQRRLQARAGEKEMAEKLFKWAEQGLLSHEPRWNKKNDHADPVQCGNYRPDYVLETDVGVTIDEYDENGHGSYKLRCELIRQSVISSGYGGRPVHWIRYNPDYFSFNGGPNPDNQTRDAIHLKHLQFAQQNPDYEFPMKVDYLFYQPMFGGVGGIVQSFKFPSILDYEDWVDTVAPDTGQLMLGSRANRSCRKLMISYSSSGGSITHTMLSRQEIFQVDECYTLTLGNQKYTLFHSPQRISKPMISNIISDMPGVQEISIGREIDQHPGFKTMVEHMNKESPLFEYWMLNGSLHTNIRGLLHKHLSPISSDRLTYSQLVQQNENLRHELQILREKETEREKMELEIEELRSEVRRLLLRTRVQEAILRPNIRPCSHSATGEGE